MIQKILNSKKKILVAGNIGIPIFDLQRNNNFKNEIIVLECSSYMLANTFYFHPRVAVITNIFPNHLDNHGSFKHYLESKLKILQNMKEDDVLIYHESLEKYEEIKNFLGRKIKIVDNDHLVYLKKHDLYYRDKIIKKNFSKLFPGLHNVLNLKMAIACGSIFDISLTKIKEEINDLIIPNYRLSKIYDHDNLIIFNDSKSTNPLALMSAIETLKLSGYSIHWIGGGKKREDDWYQLKDVFNFITNAYLYGENKLDISDALNKFQINNIVKNNLEEIIKVLPKKFNQPTCILFSPASPSLDQYSNYLQRGEHFNKLILQYYNDR